MSQGTAVILGGGAMGAAAAIPLTDAGWRVRMWTRSADVIDAHHRHLPHPRLGVRLPETVGLYETDDLALALRRADLVVVAVTSNGVAEVVYHAAPYWGHPEALIVTSKGLARDLRGWVRLMPDVARQAAAAVGALAPPIVTAAGPCLAGEIAARHSTAAVYACHNLAVAEDIAARTTTPHFRVTAVRDEAGVAACATLKNIYAGALGVADGLSRTEYGTGWVNLKAATFAQAVTEMRLSIDMVGGDPDSVFGLAGIGDLEATGCGGRNRAWGMRVGSGENPQRAYQAMVHDKRPVEGVPTSRLARKLVYQRRRDLWRKLPLLQAMTALPDTEADAETLLSAAVLPALRR